MPECRSNNGIKLVAANQILIEGSVFLRNIIIARLIGAETLGEFVFLVLSIRLFAMTTDLAEDRFIVRAPEAGLRQALASCHFLAQCRAVILAFLLLAMGLFSVKDISLVSYVLLAGAAIFRGFTHQGYRLHQRALNFRPALYVEGITAVFGVVAMYIAVAAAPCLEAVCATLLAQSMLHTGFSHVMTDRRFRFESVLYIAEFKEIAKFGLPLLLTGAAMFWSMQGERLILSAILDSASFAHFSMLFQLALVPVLILGRMTITIGLPVLSGAQENWNEFQRLLDRFHVYVYAVAAVFALLFVLGANIALNLLFGPDFEADMGWVFFLAVAQALRLCRSPQSIAAQALGQTDIPLKANLARIAFVFIAIAAVLNGAPIITLLILACVGEGAAWATQGLLFSLRNRGRIAVAQPAAMLKEA
jgi:O-antigen/teichoic acid export membrane protein